MDIEDQVSSPGHYTAYEEGSLLFLILPGRTWPKLCCFLVLVVRYIRDSTRCVVQSFASIVMIIDRWVVPLLSLLYLEVC